MLVGREFQILEPNYLKDHKAYIWLLNIGCNNLFSFQTSISISITYTGFIPIVPLNIQIRPAKTSIACYSN